MMDNLPKENLILHKSNGTINENIEAIVGEKFLIENTNVVIEEGDFFERMLPNGSTEYYRVTDRGFFKGMGSIPDHYQTSVQKVNFTIMEKELACNNIERDNEIQIEQKRNKVFVSHSSIDKDYILPFVDLLEAIGVPEDSIVCTSVPEYGVPGGIKIYEWLRKQFTECSLRVIFALSKNYYNSPASLNEMGAAWVTQACHTLILLPGFDFNDIQGCIDSTEMGIALSGDETELKHRLNELKDTLLNEYSLPPMKSEKWERKRDEFISKIRTIDPQKKDKQLEKRKSNNQGNDDVALLNRISIEGLILLVYAADAGGQIIKTSSINGLVFKAGDRNVLKDTTPRERAKWQKAVDELLKLGFVEKGGSSNTSYSVTYAGFEMADLAKEQMCIDTTKDPQDILSDYE